jgi:hypothetical protein
MSGLQIKTCLDMYVFLDKYFGRGGVLPLVYITFHNL